MPTFTGRGFLTKLMRKNTYKWLNNLYKISLSLSLSSPWSNVCPPLLSFFFYSFSPLSLHGPVWASSSGPVWAWLCIGLRTLFFWQYITQYNQVIHLIVRTNHTTPKQNTLANHFLNQNTFYFPFSFLFYTKHENLILTINIWQLHTQKTTPWVVFTCPNTLKLN